MHLLNSCQGCALLRKPLVKLLHTLDCLLKHASDKPSCNNLMGN